MKEKEQTGFRRNKNEQHNQTPKRDEHCKVEEELETTQNKNKEMATKTFYQRLPGFKKQAVQK